MTTPTSEPRQRYFDDFEVGKPLPSVHHDITRQRLVQFAAASGDFYQIHYHDDFARANELPGVLVHGALKHALLSRYLEHLAGPGGLVREVAVSFRGMDEPGTLALHGVVTGKRTEDGRGFVDAEISVESTDGRTTTPGTATIEVPLRS